VDGLALSSAWKEGRFNLVEKLPGITPPEQTSITNELARLLNTLDAVNDLGMAESVFHAVHGRHSRTGSTVDALSKGTTAPPPIEVVHTPRTGVSIKHRVMIVIDPETQASDWMQGWPDLTASTSNRQVRRMAEPAIDAWVSAMLGDPSRVCWQVSYDDGISTQLRNLKDLGISALDVIYGAGGAAPEAQSDMELALMLDAERSAPIERNPDIPIKIFVERDQQWESTVLSLAEFLVAARAVRDLIAEATPASGRHLAEIGEQASNWDLENLADRLTVAKTALGKATNQLRDFFTIDDAIRELLKTKVTAPDSIPNDLSNLLDLPGHWNLVPLIRESGLLGSDLNPLRDALLNLWFFGITGSVPVSWKGDGEEAQALLVQQAHRISIDAERRLAAANAMSSKISDNSTAEDYFAIFAEIFGRSFRVLPRFTVVKQDMLAQSLAARTQAADTGPVTIMDWLAKVTRVRPGLARLDRAFTMVECSGSSVQLGLEIAQFPLPNNENKLEHWIGNPFTDRQGPSSGCVSIAIQHLAFPLTLDHAASLSGMVIDEWDEVIPNQSETTAVAMHYDAPAAAPPNAILVAVPPTRQQPWTVNSLATVIRETIELAKIRTVDPDTTPTEFAHLLPVSIMAFNAGNGGSNGDTVSTSFRSPR
jgi:hypothetical protein